MKFEIGDKVVVKRGLEGGNTYGEVYFAKDMERFCGKTGLVTSVVEGGTPDICYAELSFDGKDSNFYWSSQMVEKEYTAKYNVGDKVRVRKDLVRNTFYGIDTVVSDMLPLLGKVVTIERVMPTIGKYSILEDGWSWTDEMFEGLAEEQSTTVVYCNFTDGGKSYLFEMETNDILKIDDLLFVESANSFGKTKVKVTSEPFKLTPVALETILKVSGSDISKLKKVLGRAVPKTTYELEAF